MLKVGDIAPDFKLPACGNRTVILSELKGRKVIVYFYPKDNTPGCTLEAIDFSNNVDEFKKANCEIIGISKNSVESHDKFCSKYDLNVVLASDKDTDVCELYGVWTQKSLLGSRYMGIDRTTFLIDEQGKIQKIWQNVKVGGHAQEVLKEVNS